jgi:hypothetical protein
LHSFVLIADRLGSPVWLAALLAVALTSTAELLLELAEYLVARPRYLTAYYDTLADMGSSFVGAVLGAAGGLLWAARRRQRP